MKSKLVQLGLPVAMLGLALGLLVPKQAGATTYYSVNIQLWPGGSSDLTCGWHGGPYVNNDATVQSGLALDWAPSSTISFYVKTLSDGSGFAYAGVAWNRRSRKQAVHTSCMQASMTMLRPGARATIMFTQRTELAQERRCTSTLNSTRASQLPQQSDRLRVNQAAATAGTVTTCINR